MDQMSFASLDFTAKKMRTKCDVCLAGMAAVMRWVTLAALIEPACRIDTDMGPHA